MIPSGVGGQRPLFGMLSNLPVTTAGVLLQTTQSIHSVIPQIKHEPMYVGGHNGILTADLYLCESGKVSSRGRPAVEANASVDILDKEHRLLVQTKIKDSLSSFVQDIPGEFDSSNNPESMLRTLVDRPPVGGREFLPLSEQSLMGFRLHPGPLPEQYRLDPLTLIEEPHKPHKKKKKHKHRHVDKQEESSLSNYSPSISREQSPPSDPCDFIKPENTPNFFPPVHMPRPLIHHPPPPSQQTIQPHLIQGNQISSHSPNIQPYLSMGGVVSSSMATPQSVPVIVQGGKMSAYSNMAAAYALSGNPAGGAASILSTVGMKIPAKPKKKRHNVEGQDGMPKKKKKKDKEKDKDKIKDKKKRKHQHPEGAIPLSSLGGIPASSATIVTPLSVVTAPHFTGVHPALNQ